MSKTIIIYDDDQEMLLLCRAILKETKYLIETISTCGNILRDIDIIKPHIILMDLWIPQTGGEKATVLVKGNPKTRHIPIILFSVNAEIKEISIRSKADGYIEKPFDIASFKEVIERYIL
ncbi:response regulator [Flavitalea flava]